MYRYGTNVDTFDLTLVRSLLFHRSEGLSYEKEKSFKINRLQQVNCVARIWLDVVRFTAEYKISYTVAVPILLALRYFILFHLIA